MPDVNGNLAENKELKYSDLLEFDRKMLKLHTDFKILDDLTVSRIYENTMIRFSPIPVADYYLFLISIQMSHLQIMEYLLLGNSKLFLIQMTRHLVALTGLTEKQFISR